MLKKYRTVEETSVNVQNANKRINLAFQRSYTAEVSEAPSSGSKNDTWGTTLTSLFDNPSKGRGRRGKSYRPDKGTAPYSILVGLFSFTTETGRNYASKKEIKG